MPRLARRLQPMMDAPLLRFHRIRELEEQREALMRKIERHPRNPRLYAAERRKLIAITTELMKLQFAKDRP